MALRKFQREFRTRTVEFVAAALGLVVGLAWNDAVKGLIEVVFPIEKNTVAVKFIYAILLTVIVVSAIILLMKFVEENTEGKK
ncbi:MAG: hypothetical protein HYT49_03565 [Candidatus Wildermuthbacteria bacterium]|nr:hypothetical protein [Candidatus Wildermuthbacteria bacterium]